MTEDFAPPARPPGRAGIKSPVQDVNARVSSISKAQIKNKKGGSKPQFTEIMKRATTRFQTPWMCKTISPPLRTPNRKASKAGKTLSSKIRPTFQTITLRPANACQPL